MSENFKNIKRRLSMSSTLPVGAAGGGMEWLFGSHGHHHVHKADGSCCDHDHHDHHAHDHTHHDHSGGCCDHHHDDEDDATNPKGGCC